LRIWLISLLWRNRTRMPMNIADGWKTACESHNQKGQTTLSRKRRIRTASNFVEFQDPVYAKSICQQLNSIWFSPVCFWRNCKTLSQLLRVWILRWRMTSPAWITARLSTASQRKICPSWARMGGTSLRPPIEGDVIWCVQVHVSDQDDILPKLKKMCVEAKGTGKIRLLFLSPE
jgi:hypothetical protein